MYLDIFRIIFTNLSWYLLGIRRIWTAPPSEEYTIMNSQEMIVSYTSTCCNPVVTFYASDFDNNMDSMEVRIGKGGGNCIKVLFIYF